MTGSLVFILATSTVTVTITEPRIRYALMIIAPELIRVTWHRAAKELVFIGRVTAVVVSIAEPSTRDANVCVWAFDTEPGCVTCDRRTIYFVSAIAILAIDATITAAR